MASLDNRFVSSEKLIFRMSPCWVEKTGQSYIRNFMMKYKQK